ncbi:T9SS type A sorting domain-containing protein [Lewinella sp. 4G2]|uniref:T9SS type A sorting domain-containing protein n=1 Tax=Lewinella sp. 4G2 TaxID=1803372 RepID=UPI0018D31D97|nr:T9SS type A sorting domain-containing protein [Lewinella sp. 4G2]
MKNLFYLLAIIPGFLSAQVDTVYAFEGFDYAPLNGMFELDGGSEQGWTSPWEREIGDDGIIRRGDIPTDLIGPSDGGTRASLEFVRAGIRYNRRMRRQLDDGREYWVSCIMNWLPGSANGNVGNLTLTQNNQQVISVGKKFGNGRIAIVLPGGVNFETNIAAEGIHTLLLKIETSGNNGAEMAYLWVDPDLATLGADPDVSTANVRTPANTFRANNGVDGVQLKVEGTPPLLVDYDRLVIGGSLASVSPGFLVNTSQTTLAPLPLSVFPNPLREVATTTFSLTTPGTLRIALWDLNGRLIRDYGEAHYPAGISELSLRLGGSSIPTGTYILRVTGEQVAGSVKVIID